jgi:glycine/D-amino acid oxidase-like deaminating enzyme
LLAFDKIVKQNNIFLAQLGNDLYWVGATYEWHFENDAPTETARLELLERLDTVLKMPYQVIDHWAAIRPTVKDRRPFLGQHGEFPQLWIFNGLGTKGASLAPFWANHLSEAIQNDSALDPEVSIERFKQ